MGDDDKKLGSAGSSKGNNDRPYLVTETIEPEIDLAPKSESLEQPENITSPTTPEAPLTPTVPSTPTTETASSPFMVSVPQTPSDTSVSTSDKLSQGEAAKDTNFETIPTPPLPETEKTEPSSEVQPQSSAVSAPPPPGLTQNESVNTTPTQEVSPPSPTIFPNPGSTAKVIEKPKSPKSRLTLLVLILTVITLIIIAGVAVLAYQNYQLQQEIQNRPVLAPIPQEDLVQPTPQSDLEATESAESVETSTWETYQDDSLYSFKYPERFERSEYNEGELEGISLVMIGDSQTQSGRTQTSLSDGLIVRTLVIPKKSRTLKAYIEELRTIDQNAQPSESDNKVTPIEEVEIDGKEALAYTSIGTGGKVRVVLTESNNQFIRITGNAQGSEEKVTEYLGLFEKVLSTFSFVAATE